MVRVEHVVEIARPPADVFAFLTDPSNLPRWQESCVAAQAEHGQPISSGTRIAERRRFLGQEARTLMEVVELEPHVVYELESVEGPFPLTVRHELEECAGGTRVRVVAEADPGRLLRLASRMVDRAVREATRKDFAKLKALLEAPEAPAA
jgi:carbon monoxide dehydrogenase subunit G